MVKKIEGNDGQRKKVKNLKPHCMTIKFISQRDIVIKKQQNGVDFVGV